MKLSTFYTDIARDVLGVSPSEFARVLRMAESRNDVPDWSEATDADIKKWWVEVTS
jgi:DNA-binding transcriptional regulator YiaG